MHHRLRGGRAREAVSNLEVRITRISACDVHNNPFGVQSLIRRQTGLAWHTSGVPVGFPAEGGQAIWLEVALRGRHRRSRRCGGWPGDNPAVAAAPQVLQAIYSSPGPPRTGEQTTENAVITRLNSRWRVFQRLAGPIDRPEGPRPRRVGSRVHSDSPARERPDPGPHGTLAEYARSAGLTPNELYSWKAMLRRCGLLDQPAASGASGFVRVIAPAPLAIN